MQSVHLSVQLKQGTSLNREKKNFCDLVINSGSNLVIFVLSLLAWQFFLFLIRAQVRLSAQLKQASTQKFWFLSKRPGHSIGHLR